MLNFVREAVSEAEGVELIRPNDKPVSGRMLADLTLLVVHRFLESIEWDDVVEIYLAGLVDGEDLQLIQRAVRKMVEGGVTLG